METVARATKKLSLHLENHHYSITVPLRGLRVGLCSPLLVTRDSCKEPFHAVGLFAQLIPQRTAPHQQPGDAGAQRPGEGRDAPSPRQNGRTARCQPQPPPKCSCAEQHHRCHGHPAAPSRRSASGHSKKRAAETYNTQELTHGPYQARRQRSDTFEPMFREDWRWKTPNPMRTGRHIRKKSELDSRKEGGLQGWSNIFLPRQQHVLEPGKSRFDQLFGISGFREPLLTVTRSDCMLCAPETRQTPVLLQTTLTWLGIFYHTIEADVLKLESTNTNITVKLRSCKRPAENYKTTLEPYMLHTIHTPHLVRYQLLHVTIYVQYI